MEAIKQRLGKLEPVVYAALRIIAGAMFASQSGVKLVHVPYKGAAPALTDALGGQIDMIFASMVTALPYIKAQRLRALAQTGATRSRMLPDLPTVAEAGNLPKYEIWGWYGVYLPAATPKEIVTRLNAELARIVNSGEIRDKLVALALEPVGDTPEHFATFLKEDIARYAKVIKDAGIKLE